jgi:REP element-mobilizing transposase RayT
MRFIPGARNRRSVRLKEYGYVQAGAYFVTICTYNRDCLFGEVVDGEMRLNEYGEIARDEWIKTASVRTSVVLDVFVIMPNHIHGIIILTGNGSGNVGAARRVAPNGRVARTMQPGSIGAIIGQFKSIATKRINKRRGTPGLPVWQRNYYERVLREDELDRVRAYIQNNPAQWEMDAENPISS